MDLWNGIGMGLPVAGIGWLGLRWILRRGNRHPAALAGAQQIWTEREFSMDEPVRLVARVDAAWRLESGEIVLVEVKHRQRDKVYRSDVLQLSAQRLAVMADSGQSVVGWAFVCVIRGALWRRTRWHRVELMDEREVVEAVRRRLLLLEGTIGPRAAHGGRVCLGCSHRRVCEEWGRWSPLVYGSRRRLPAKSSEYAQATRLPMMCGRGSSSRPTMFAPAVGSSSSGRTDA